MTRAGQVQVPALAIAAIGESPNPTRRLLFSPCAETGASDLKDKMPAMQGWLAMRDSAAEGRAWPRRWFVLRHGRLLCKDAESKSLSLQPTSRVVGFGAASLMNLSGALSEIATQADDHPWGFVLDIRPASDLTNRVLVHLDPGSPDALEAWVGAIGREIGRLSGIGARGEMDACRSAIEARARAETFVNSSPHIAIKHCSFARSSSLLPSWRPAVLSPAAVRASPRGLADAAVCHSSGSRSGSLFQPTPASSRSPVSPCLTSSASPRSLAGSAPVLAACAQPCAPPEGGSEAFNLKTPFPHEPFIDSVSTTPTTASPSKALVPRLVLPGSGRCPSTSSRCGDNDQGLSDHLAAVNAQLQAELAEVRAMGRAAELAQREVAEGAIAEMLVQSKAAGDRAVEARQLRSELEEAVSANRRSDLGGSLDTLELRLAELEARLKTEEVIALEEKQIAQQEKLMAEQAQSEHNAFLASRSSQPSASPSQCMQANDKPKCIQMNFCITSISFERLTDGHKDVIRHSVASKLAAVTKLDRERVRVYLSSGSVRVTAEIFAPEAQKVEDIRSLVVGAAGHDVAAAVLAEVKAIADIHIATEGPIEAIATTSPSIAVEVVPVEIGAWAVIFTLASASELGPQQAAELRERLAAALRLNAIGGKVQLAAAEVDASSPMSSRGALRNISSREDAEEMSRALKDQWHQVSLSANAEGALTEVQVVMEPDFTHGGELSPCDVGVLWRAFLAADVFGEGFLTYEQLVEAVDNACSMNYLVRPEGKFLRSTVDNCQKPRKLRISVLKATHLRSMNLVSTDSLCCVCEVKRPGKKQGEFEFQTMGWKQSLDPEWNETHDVSNWNVGEDLELTVYDQGMLSNKLEGRVLVPSNLFYPHGFEGGLPIVGLEGSTLYLHIHALPAPVADFLMFTELFVKQSKRDIPRDTSKVSSASEVRIDPDLAVCGNPGISPSTFSPNLAFPVGAELVCVRLATVRKAESIESMGVGELHVGRRCTVLARGEENRRRLFVAVVGADIEGWISCATASGDVLVTLAEAPHTSFGVGSEIVCMETIRVRSAESMDSAAVGELDEGQHCTVLGHGLENGRRLRILAVGGTKMQGWISCATTTGRQLVRAATYRRRRHSMYEFRGASLRSKDGAGMDIQKTSSLLSGSVVPPGQEAGKFGSALGRPNQSLHIRPNHAYEVGMNLVLTDPVIVRRHEDTSSEKVVELAPNTRCVVMERGVLDEGRKLMVSVPSLNVVGWISCVTAKGDTLVDVVVSDDVSAQREPATTISQEPAAPLDVGRHLSSLEIPEAKVHPKQEEVKFDWSKVGSPLIGKRLLLVVGTMNVDATVVAWDPKAKMFRVMRDDGNEEDLDQALTERSIKLLEEVPDRAKCQSEISTAQIVQASSAAGDVQAGSPNIHECVTPKQVSESSPSAMIVAETTNTEAEIWNETGSDLIGSRVRRILPGGPMDGVVVAWNGKGLHRIVFDDGDKNDLEQSEILDAVRAFAEANKDEAPTRVASVADDATPSVQSSSPRSVSTPTSSLGKDAPNKAFAVGCTITCVEATTVRIAESLDSPHVAEWTAGQQCRVLGHGVDNGRRLRVSALAHTVEGWISCTTAAGQKLVRLVDDAKTTTTAVQPEDIVEQPVTIVVQPTSGAVQASTDAVQPTSTGPLLTPRTPGDKTPPSLQSQLSRSSIVSKTSWGFPKGDSPSKAYPVGAEIVCLHPTVVRSEESIESAVITELEEGHQCKVAGHSMDKNGRRLRVSFAMGGAASEGWISCATVVGTRLVRLVPDVQPQPVKGRRSLLGFGGLMSPGLMSPKGEAKSDQAYPIGAEIVLLHTATVRSDETTTSSVVAELQEGQQCTVLAHGAENGRRLRVSISGRNAEGWISSSTADGTKLIRLAMETPRRKSLFNFGSSSRSNTPPTSPPSPRDSPGARSDKETSLGRGTSTAAPKTTEKRVAAANQIYEVGQVLELTAASVMRREESMQSEKILELKAGQRCVVQQIGVQDTGRRLLVHVPDRKQSGWISCVTATGDKLVKATAPAPPIGAAQDDGREEELPAAGVDEAMKSFTQAIAAEEDSKAATGPALRQPIQPQAYELRNDEVEAGWTKVGSPLIGKRVRRVFNGQPTNGTVVAWHPANKHYRALHDDGDDEDLDQAEIEQAIKLYPQFFRSSARELEKASPQAATRPVAVNKAFPVGTDIVCIHAARARSAESTESAAVGELRQGTVCTVLEHGVESGRRLRVCSSDKCIEGWISCTTAAGEKLVKLAPPKRNLFAFGQKASPDRQSSQPSSPVPPARPAFERRPSLFSFGGGSRKSTTAAADSAPSPRTPRSPRTGLLPPKAQTPVKPSPPPSPSMGGRLMTNLLAGLSGTRPSPATTKPRLSLTQSSGEVEAALESAVPTTIANESAADAITSPTTELRGRPAWTPTARDQRDGWQITGHQAIGQRLRRSFPSGEVNGTVVAWNIEGPEYYKVIHDDGDEEDLNEEEYAAAVQLYKESLLAPALGAAVESQKATCRYLRDEDVKEGWMENGHELIGLRVLRQFPSGPIEGTVVAWSSAEPLFRIRHDDNDIEDLTEEELAQARSDYETRDRTPTSSKQGQELGAEAHAQGVTLNQHELHMQLLQSVPLLSRLTVDEQSKLAEVLVPKTYQAGEFIVRQDEVGQDMYFIELGSAHAEENGSRVIDFGPASFFGELALLKSQPNAADVIADASPTKVVSLSADSFNRLLGSLSDLMLERANQQQTVTA